MRIRRALAADADACAAVLRASIRQLCANDHGGDPEAVARWCANKTPAHLARWIEAPDQRLFVAERAGRVLGVASIATDGEVLLNYVAPDARFRGVSTALLARLERELAALGHVEARLESTRTAHRFYRARGWRDDGPPVDWLGLPGQPMVKRVG
jgi:GNAT superfamily N-acetyltransferase